MLRLAQILIVCLTLSAPAWASGGLVVIVNKASGVQRLSRDDAVNIFMGRYQRLPSGITALPVDDNPLKAAFYQALVGRNLPQIRSYWARLIFSGQGSPPRQMNNADEVITAVSENKGAIGYVDRAQVDNRVRVVLSLTP